jgi:predicted double-glycine peptidase
MFEFSHEANAALHVLHENLKLLVDTTVNTTAAKIAVDHDASAFLHRVGKAALAATRAAELLVAAVSESSRQTGVFPTVIPRRPQPVNGNGHVVTMLNGAEGSGRANKSPPRRANSNAGNLTARPAAAGLAASGEPGGERTSRANSIVAGTAPKAAAQGAASLNASGVVTQSPALSAQPHSATQMRHGTSNDTKEGIVATGAYMLLELLVRETMAREAVWYAHSDGADEVKAIAVYAAKPKAPAAAKAQLRVGIVGAVLRCGIAVNVCPEQPTETNGLALCFPIFAATNRSQPIGAVTLQHKANGDPFTKADEAIAANWTILAARLMGDYGVDLTAHHFDPFKVLLNVTSPHAAYAEQGYGRVPYGNLAELRGKRQTDEASMLQQMMNEAARLLEMQAVGVRANELASSSKGLSSAGGNTTTTAAEQRAPKSQQLLSRAAGIASYSRRLAESVAEFPPPFRVFRSVHHNHFTVVRGAKISGSGVTLPTQNLMDVAEYIASLEECWRRTTEDLQGVEQEHVAQMEDFRARKRKLKAAQSKASELEGQKHVYEERYEALKLELAAVCGRPVDDPSFNNDVKRASVLTPTSGRKPSSPQTARDGKASFLSIATSGNANAKLPTVRGSRR